MAVPFTRLASQVLDNHATKLNNALKEANGVVSVLGDRGSIQFENGGGTNFKERILYGQNSNVGFRSKTAQIPTADDDGVTMVSVPQRTISGSIVVNQVEKDQVKGKWAIGQLLSDKMTQFRTTWTQKWAEILLQATPAANDPYTLLPSGTSGTINGILSPVLPSGAAGTTGGISRADNDWWRNQYFGTAIDISTEAGDASLYENLYSKCLFGSAKQDEPDFGLTDFGSFGDLGASASAKRRGTLSDQSVTKLGFRNIMYYNAAIITESSSRMANKFVLLNTRDLVIKVLRPTGGSISMADQANGLGSVPVVMKGFQQDIDTLNEVSLGYVVAGLVPRLLRTHGLADNIT